MSSSPQNNSLEHIYKRSATDTSPNSLDDKVLQLAAQKAQQLQQTKKDKPLWWAQSHWLGLASACCAMVLMISVLVPLTQPPLLQTPELNQPALQKKQAPSALYDMTEPAAERALNMEMAPARQESERAIETKFQGAPIGNLRQEKAQARIRIEATEQQRSARKAVAKPQAIISAPLPEAFEESITKSVESKAYSLEPATDDVIEADTTANQHAEEMLIKDDQHLLSVDDWHHKINTLIGQKADNIDIEITHFKEAYPNEVLPKNWLEYMQGE